jgi:microcystin-dependent protein
MSRYGSINNSTSAAQSGYLPKASNAAGQWNWTAPAQAGLIPTGGILPFAGSSVSTPPESIFATYGGAGTQGAVTVSSDTVFSAIDGATPGKGEYTSLHINTGVTLTIDTKIAYIAVQGDCHIHGTLSAYGGTYASNPGQYTPPGTLGNQNTTGGLNGLDSTGAASTAAVAYCWAGSGGGSSYPGSGGGAGGVGGTGVGVGVNIAGNSYANLITALQLGKITGTGASLASTLAAGGGGSSATTHTGESVNAGGGGVIYLEIGGALYFDGVLQAQGTTGSYIPNARSIGGGGGGVIIVRTKYAPLNTGTTNVAGGLAGGSGSGASSSDGGPGKYYLNILPALAGVPDGYLLCNGDSKTVAAYSSLWAIIGDTYGGDGGTNFNVPDLRARIPMGVNTDGPLSDTRTNKALASTAGEETHVLSIAELASHDHGFGAAATNHGTTVAGHTITSGTARLTTATGSNTAHNTLQPYITINYIIKT